MIRATPRSVLYVPASKPRAMARAETCGADCIIFDLEDAVGPDEKNDAREALRAHFLDAPAGGEPVGRGIRINALQTEWGTEDLLAARACRPDFLVVPKVSGPQDLEALDLVLAETDAPDDLKVWAMIETAAGIVNAPRIAAASRRLQAMMAGLNDLMLETGLGMGADGSRRHLEPLLVQMMIAARAAGIWAIDGVCNDFRDAARLVAECREARLMGLDGKSLIHPAQVDAANAAFGPGPDDIAAAREVVAAFADPANAGKGVISAGGRMLELLHLHQARAVLQRAGQDDEQ